MSVKDFTANVISKTPIVPDGNFKDSKASGIWDINEALDLIKGGNWPNVANFNPAAFVDGLFSTFIHDGGSAQDIVNGIDLTKGGLVWSKARDYALDHGLFDSENSNFGSYLSSNDNGASTSLSGHVTPNNNGFSLSSLGSAPANASGTNYVSWTFRKQPKFFDIVTYTGTGSARTVAHNLGSVPGMIMVKVTSTSDSWALYHRGSNGGTNPEDYMLRLNTTDAQANNADYWNDTAPTNSVFTVGTDPGVNGDGVSYVAYIFAHNNDDGGFGEPGDQDIIKCGSYTASNSGVAINLGFEPQWVLIKRTDAAQSWYIFDTMRGFTVSDNPATLKPDDTEAEGALAKYRITSTGFQWNSDSGDSGRYYAYMAIRRGGMQTPTAASDVFAIDTQSQSSAPYAISNFPVDMALRKDTDGSSTDVHARLTQGRGMFASSTAAEGDDNIAQFDYQNGYMDNTSQDSTKFAWMWKRARGYFDVATYIGDGATNHNVSHNLGVSPEMIWIKNRGDSTNWVVWHKDLSSGKYLRLETTAAELNQSGILGTASVGATTFPVGSNSDNTNKSSNNYIAHLFATVAGVSKVGSVSHSGSSTDVDCGFTSGASLVILKRTDNTGSWLLFDSVRGIIAGNSPYLKLQSTAAEVTSVNQLNPLSSGFQIPDGANDGDYIFYAIAAIS